MKLKYKCPFDEIWKLEDWIKKNGRHFKKHVANRFKDDENALQVYNPVDEPAPDWGPARLECVILPSGGRAD